MHSTTEGPIACDLTRIPAEQRERFLLGLRRTFARARAVHATGDGFALEFPNEDGLAASLGEFIEYDRRCCPFMRHTLIHEPWDGPIRLELTGPREGQASLAHELSRILPPELYRRPLDGP